MAIPSRFAICAWVLFACLAANRAVAQEDDVLRELGATDPQQREAARKRLDELPDWDADKLLEASKHASDPEVRAALREAGETLLWRGDRKRVEKFRDRHGSAIELMNWRVIRDWDDHAVPMLIVMLSEDFRIQDPFYVETAPSGPGSEDCAASEAAGEYLRGMTRLTLSTQSEWMDWYQANRGKTLLTIIHESLVRDGFRTMDADDETAAGELVRACERAWESLKEPECTWHREEHCYVLESLLDEAIAQSFGSEWSFTDLPPERGHWRAWLASNEGFIRRKGGEFVTEARPKDWVGRLSSKNDDAILGALVQLRDHNGFGTEKARLHAREYPSLVAELLREANLPASPEELQAILETDRDKFCKGAFYVQEEMRIVFSFDSASRLLDEGPAPDFAARLLLVVDKFGTEQERAKLGHKHFEHLSDGSPEDHLWEAMIVAAEGTDEEARKSIPWAEGSASRGRFALAMSLAKRGLKESLPAMERQVTGRRLGWDEVSQAHDVFPGCPEGKEAGLDGTWKAWVGAGLDRYHWSPSEKRWIEPR